MWIIVLILCWFLCGTVSAYLYYQDMKISFPSILLIMFVSLWFGTVGLIIVLILLDDEF